MAKNSSHPRWERPGIAQRPCGQLRWFPSCFAEQAAFFGNGPDLCLTFMSGLKDEVLPIRCPTTAAFLGDYSIREAKDEDRFRRPGFPTTNMIRSLRQTLKCVNVSRQATNAANRETREGRELFGFRPIVLATYRSWPLAKSIRCPSGDQVPSWPISSPKRRGVPAGSGNTQSGASSSSTHMPV